MNELNPNSDTLVSSFSYVPEKFVERIFVSPNSNTETIATSRVFSTRIITTVSSGASMLACLTMFYFYFAMHHPALKLRHRLITFLIFFDLIRAVAIIIYPILTFTHFDIDHNRTAVNFLGFFTATAIEGGDLAILTFALYSLITIYYPNGGQRWLSQRRYTIYLASFFTPLIMASMAFIGQGYIATQVYCYLPYDPLWYRLVLSWGPRYFIMIAISIIYFYIYYYVRSQLKKLEHEVSFKVLDNTTEGDQDQSPQRKPSTLERLSNWILNIDPENISVNSTTAAATTPSATPISASISNTFTLPPPIYHFDINRQLQINNQIRLKNRYKVITRQITEIFLYPTAYFLIWVFPLISHALNMADVAIPYWINVLTTLSVPICGLVDTLVFFYREKPWQLTYKYYDLCHTHDHLNYHDLQIPKWRISLQWLPFYDIPQEYFKVKELEKRHMSLLTLEQIDINVQDKYLNSAVSIVPYSVNSSDHSKPTIIKESLNSRDIDDDYYKEEIDFLDILRTGPGGQDSA